MNINEQNVIVADNETAAQPSVALQTISKEAASEITFAEQIKEVIETKKEEIMKEGAKQNKPSIAKTIATLKKEPVVMKRKDVREFMFNEMGSLIVTQGKTMEVLIPRPYSLLIFAAPVSDPFSEWRTGALSHVYGSATTIVAKWRNENPPIEAYQVGFQTAVHMGLLKKEDYWKFELPAIVEIKEQPLPPKPKHIIETPVPNPVIETPAVEQPTVENNPVVENPATKQEGEPIVNNNQTPQSIPFWSNVRIHTVTPINTHVVQPVWAGKYGLKAGYNKVSGWLKQGWNWITATPLKRETSCGVAAAVCYGAVVITPVTWVYALPSIALPYAARGINYGIEVMTPRVSKLWTRFNNWRTNLNGNGYVAEYPIYGC